jgi:[ribosomal protein S5]-alanine N-acetyltransferase
MFSIKTKRLILRDLKPSDWRLFCDLMKDPQTSYYMGDYLKSGIEEAKAWVKERTKYNSENPRHSYNLVIELNQEPVGWIGIGEAEKEEKKDLDFGYALMKHYWGQGIMTEALQALLNFCFQNIGIKRITGDCEASNFASRKVMEKSGMTLLKKFIEKDEKTGLNKEKCRYFIEK